MSDDIRNDEEPINAPPIGHGERLAPRPAEVQRFMAAPLILASLLMLATGTLAVLSWIGGTADGDTVRMTFAGTCAAEAAPFVEARANAMGLGTPRVSVESSGLSVVAQLPGMADNERDHVPAVLARRGWFVAGPAHAPIFDRAGIDEASIRLDESGMPYTWLDLKPLALEALEAAAKADPEGEMAISLDGHTAPARPFNKPINENGIRVLPGDGLTRDRMQVAADHTIVLTHGPLPCDLQVVSVETVTQP